MKLNKTIRNFFQKIKYNNLLKFFIFGLVFSIIFPNSVYAYAGPGAALAAVVVFITVVLAFFASTLLSIFDFIKKNIKKNKKKHKKSIKRK